MFGEEFLRSYTPQANRSEECVFYTPHASFSREFLLHSWCQFYFGTSHAFLWLVQFNEEFLLPLVDCA